MEVKRAPPYLGQHTFEVRLSLSSIEFEIGTDSVRATGSKAGFGVLGGETEEVKGRGCHLISRLHTRVLEVDFQITTNKIYQRALAASCP
jgi:hypothetical protein